ncbi:MAG TPA: carboxypeptidase-like regulatory domain-containing protein [Bryobacteraceae bacterium]|jgi:hypothetical protein|nr:carboxypeptidase-like regulatory domain-containing protein [Bryobacteraceae bacterium]
MFRRLLTIAIFGSAFIALLAAHQVPDNSAHGNPSFGNYKAPKKDKAPTSRSLRGTVTDDTGQPMAGALVTLTDDSTKDKLTFITKKDGKYNFADLSFNKDYEVVARHQDQVSSPRKLSQYDHTADIVRILELEQPEAKK